MSVLNVTIALDIHEPQWGALRAIVALADATGLPDDASAHMTYEEGDQTIPTGVQFSINTEQLIHLAKSKERTA